MTQTPFLYGGSSPTTHREGFNRSKDFRGRNGHTNRMILHSGFKAQGKGDSRHHGLQDPSVYVVCWAPRCAGGADPKQHD